MNILALKISVCLNVVNYSNIRNIRFTPIKKYNTLIFYKSRLTIVSHEAKKKQDAQPLSELFAYSTALKFVNVLS